MKIGAAIIIVLIIVVEVRSYLNSGNEGTSDKKGMETITPEETLSRERAFYASKEYVQQILIEADSIVFPVYGEQVLIASDNNHKIYTIETWVDEINAAGIGIRHEFKAEMAKKEEHEWHCRSLILDGKKIR